jgi:dienelactone hydrolase
MRPVSATPVRRSLAVAFALTLSTSLACDPPRPRPTTGEAPLPEVALGAGGAAQDAPPRRAPNLAAAKQGRATAIVREARGGGPPPAPPAGYELVRYPSPAGALAAYVATPSGRAEPGPAVVYVLGGFSNGVGATPWAPAERANDQSGRAFTEAGLTVMWPSRRGGHDNPGVKEGFYGEVDDVLAARAWLAKQPYVDPERIYLVGHSTGGVVAMLAAASSDGDFRAVFASGPVHDPSVYGAPAVVYDTTDPEERRLRAPMEWLWAIADPTYVFEGDQGRLGARGAESIRAMQANSENPSLRFAVVEGMDHFSVLRPATEAIAAAIVADTGEGEFAAELTAEVLAAGAPRR